MDSPCFKHIDIFGCLKNIMKKNNLHIGKIVGTADNSVWSQNHIFLPLDDNKRKKFGSILVSLSLKSKEEAVDITSFGKEIISRLQEIYYSSEKETILDKIKTSINALVEEFRKMVEMELVLGVVVEVDEHKSVGYFASFGKGRIYIFRNGQLVNLGTGETETIKLCSGFLQPQDLFIIGTSQLFEIVSLGLLKAACENNDIELIVESLASIIHAHSPNSQTAAVIFQAEENRIVEKQEVLIQTKVTSKPGVRERLKTMKSNWPVFWQGLREATQKSSLYLKDDQKTIRAKKTTLSVAVILISLLIISVVFGIRKKAVNQETKISSSLLQEGSYEYEQAVPLEELNPLRAKQLLSEARDSLKQNVDKIKDKGEKAKINDLLAKIETELEKVAREYKIDKADIFLDLSLAKEDFKASNWAMIDKLAYVFDDSKGTVLSVDINSKAFKVVSGGDKLVNGRLLAASSNRAYVETQDKILTIDLVKTTLISETKAEDWGEIIDMTAFGSTVYLLDKTKGQVWKYRPTDNGLLAKSVYLKTAVDFNSALSFTIDGSVWVIFNDGSIKKYTRGEADNYVVSGLDKNISQEAKIFTNETLDNLYILDRKNTRVLVLSKTTGEYQAQYFWPGIAGVSDLASFEDMGKILLLAGERIYQIDLRK
jgi:hypothetical protein